MDLIRQQLQRIAAQMSALTVSQKMLVASLLAIVVITLWFSTQYAGRREMTALFDANMPADQLTQVTAALDSAGIEYTETGGKIMVPVEKRLAAWSQTSYVGALPQNSQSAFDKMLENVNPWDSTGVLKERFNRAREVTLSQMIAQWKEVSKAEVVIDSREKIGVVQRIEPSATVSIQRRNGNGNSRKLAETAADTVSGAIAGMKRSNVQVVIDGMSYLIRDRDAEGMAGNEIIDMLRSHEQRIEEKILAHFSYIRGLTVGVTAELNTKSIQQRTRSADKGGSLSLPRLESSQTVESASKSGQSEPGALPNIGLGESGSASGESNSKEVVTSEFDNEIGVTETTTRDPAGNAKIVGASLRVPRSYFVQVWKQRHPDQQEPTDDDLTKNMKFEFDAMRADVKNLTGIDTDDLVSIQDYTELDVAFAPGGAAASTSSGGVASLTGGYVREIGVGLLAVVSLFMVARMVKKGSSIPTPRPGPAPVSRPQPLMAALAESIAGVAPEGLSTLTAQELDVDSLESRQIVDQVTTLVKEDPEMAANLIKKWLKN